MWTPKRVLLLVAGFVVFCGAYATYARVLGGIDGLPALPPQYCRGEPGPIEPPPISRIEEKLQQAFGPGCEELKMKIQVESPRDRDKTFVLAARDCDWKDGDNKVYLTPLSMAWIKTIPNKDHPEINTLHGASAVLTLDGPIKNGPLDMGKRKVVKAEVQPSDKDPIVIRHLRYSRADAIEAIIKKGPVFFDDDQRLIFSDEHVEVQDLQSKPEPMRMEGNGLRVQLAPNAPPGDKGRTEKPKNDSGGVEKIVLLSAVDMHLYPEAGSGFPALGESPAPAPAKPAAGSPKADAAPPDHIRITTDGPFVYDLTQSLARFDIPAKTGPLTPDCVTVVRNPRNDRDPHKQDTLHCEHLELQFVRKAAEPPAKQAAPTASGDDNPNLQIDWVHAWGNKVDFTSNEQNATGEGNDLYYQTAAHRSVLKGSPQATLITDKNEITAPELELIRTPDAGPVKGQQLVTATGKGSLHLWNKTTGTRTLHARWQDQFKSRREGDQDVLTFTGRAALVEDEHLIGDDIFFDNRLLSSKSVLKADYLQIWLDPPAPAPAGQKPLPPPAAPARPGDGAQAQSGGRRPRRVEANGHVEARSPDMRILVGEQYPVTQRLTMYFKDVNDPAAAVAVVAKPADPPPASGTGQTPIVVPPPTTTPPAGPALNPESPPDKPPRPVELCAAFITAHVLRYNPSGKTEIDKMDTEGAVQVIQQPSGDDKGFFIRGDKVNLTRKMAGCNHLKVSSDPSELAELRMGTNTIVGPQVEIDQADNTVDVEGSGYMKMENTTDFQGNPLKKPEILTVHWNRLMHFEGTNAEFVGDIQAEQGHSHLQSQTLRAEFDKPISLNDQRRAEKKEPGKDSESARVKTLVCERSVKVDEEMFETWYCLNNAALTALRTPAMPAVVLDRLTLLKDKTYDSREKFVAELGRLLPKDVLDKVQPTVLAQASFEAVPPRLTGFKSLDCVTMTVWNLQQQMTAIGPGILRIVQPGGGIGTPVGGPPTPKTPAKPAAGAKPAAAPEWTLTQINYGRFGGGLGQNSEGAGWMDADNNSHTATFHHDIQVLHIPWNNDRKKMREPVNPSLESGRLRPGGLYMECEKTLKIYSPEEDLVGGTRSASDSGKHIMTGTGRVYLKAVDANGKVFWGTADVVHYDEAKDQVTFDGKDGIAELFQQDRPGAEPTKTQGKTIIYWRQTGEVQYDQIIGGTGRQ